jgi:hypothetical protein
MDILPALLAGVSITTFLIVLGLGAYAILRHRRRQAHTQEYYAQAKEELRIGAIKPDTWQAALQAAEGDTQAAKLSYIRLRVQEQRELAREHQQAGSLRARLTQWQSSLTEEDDIPEDDLRKPQDI